MVERDGTPRVLQRDCVWRVRDVRRHVEHHERALHADELLLHRSDRRADRLQRPVDGGDIRKKYVELTNAQRSVQNMQRADAKHEGRARCGPGVDHE